MENLYETYFDSTDWAEPYLSSADLMENIRAYIDMYIETALTIKQEKQAGRPFHLSGIVITPEEVKATVEAGKLRYRHYALKPEVVRSIQKGWEHIISRKEASETMRLFEIKKRFMLNSFEFFAFLMALCLESDRKYERLFGYLQDNVNQYFPTLGLAKSLYSLTEIVPDNCVFLACEKGRRAEMLLFGGENLPDKTPFLSKPMKLAEKVVSYVNDRNEVSPKIRFCGEYIRHDASAGKVFINERKLTGMAKTMETALNEHEPTMLQIFGPKGTGKSFALGYLSRHCGRDIFCFDVENALNSGKNIYELLRSAIIEAVVEDSLLCLKNIPALDEETEKTVQNMIQTCRNYLDILLITSEEKNVYRYSLDYQILQIKYDMPEYEERLLLWNEFLKGKALAPSFEVETIANRFILTPKQIQNVIASAYLSAIYDGRQEMTEEDFVGAVRVQSLNRLREKATLVKADYTWDDLIAEEEQKRMMLYALNHIKYKNKVNKEWGFEKKLSYGKGLSILFYGPPGTGKTMAAQVIANELKLELYKVDLSQMVSKYIGETEKNLSVLFNEAKYANAILFFDEADALFSKRTEVSDSKDKYSNVETSFLLQKIEEFEGITILASNYLVNFDDAFKRRISFIINFQLPGAEMRYELWKSMIPKNAPTDGSIDYDFLANSFEFSGSNIKNIVVLAAYMAAAENTAISMKHIVAAIKVENAKFGKVLLKHEFGRYAQYY